jgi:hypothetical protein
MTAPQSLIVILLLAAAPGPARAQTTGGFASISAAAARIEDSTRGSFVAGIGYRFTRAVAVGMDVTFVPKIRPQLPSIVPLEAAGVAGITVPVPSFILTPDGGRATLFTATLRLEPPAPSTRVVPFIVGGAGVGSVTDRWRETISYPLAITNIVIPTTIESFSQTTSGFAVTLGGGISVLAGRHLSVDGDVRYIGLLGDRDLRIGRFGGGLTYKF